MHRRAAMEPDRLLPRSLIKPHKYKSHFVQKFIDQQSIFRHSAVRNIHTKTMRRRLPPLKPLPAFEIAAERLSFTDAAGELHLTHGAISRQIKALESHLGVTLFRRRNRH